HGARLPTLRRVRRASPAGASQGVRGGRLHRVRPVHDGAERHVPQVHLLRRDERLLLTRSLGEIAMDSMIARGATRREPDLPADERAVHDAVLREAARQFQTAAWRLVANARDRSIYGVAEGLYPDLVALDGTDAGVAWILEIETPTTLASDAAWLRLRRAAET